jgi:hypothetical protein
MLGLPHLLGVFLITTGLTGCALLDMLIGLPPGFDPDASFPPFPIASAESTFTTGSATLEIDGETLVLDELVSGGSMMDDFGVRATWTDGEGLYLTFSGYPDMGFGSESGYLSIDRIFDDQHWVMNDPTRCVTTTEQADATGITGTATCRGLRWSDYFSTLAGLGVPVEIEGEPPFDAEITFEAR